MKILEKSIQFKSEKHEDFAENSFTRPSIVLAIFATLVGFILSGAFVKGAALPIGPALATAFSPLYGICVYGGALISYFVTGRITDFFTEIAVIPTIILVKIAFGSKLSSKKSLAIMNFFVYSLLGIVVSFAFKIDIILIVAILLRGIISAVFTYFVSEFSTEFSRKKTISIFAEKSVALAVIYIILIASLCSVRFGTVNIARIFGIFLILASSLRFGVFGGVFVGALTSFGVILGENGNVGMSDMIRSTAILSCSGIVSGYFSKKGKFTVSLSYLISTFLLTLFAGKISFGQLIFTDTFIASFLFFIIPEKYYINKFNFVFKNKKNLLSFEEHNIKFVSQAIDEIKSTTDRAASVLIANNGGDFFEEVTSSACEKICKKCKSNTYCNFCNKNNPSSAFEMALSSFKNKGYVAEKDLPSTLENCTKKAEMLSIFNLEFTKNLRNDDLVYMERKLYRNFSNQFLFCRDVLDFINKNIVENYYLDDIISTEVSEQLRKFGANDPSSICFYDNFMYITAIFSGELALDSIAPLTEKLSNITACELDFPLVYNFGDYTKISWHQNSKFSVSYGISSKKGSCNVSGDNSSIVKDMFGNIIFFISDGMGSGERAAIESKMLIKLLSDMIKAGFPLLNAVKYANNIHLAKSSDEVFATLDIVSVNIFTGIADFYKFGAAPSILIKENNFKIVEGFSTPIGILPEITPYKTSVKLNNRDFVVMITDGVPSSSYDFIVEKILSGNYSLQKCSDEIVADEKISSAEVIDDRTAICLQILEI